MTRLEARGDPATTAKSKAATIDAGRLTKASEQGITLRDQLPSRRVAALYLPEHRLVRSGKGFGCKQSGRAWSLLSSWDRAAEVHRCRIHSLPPCPSCLRAPALAVTAIHRRPLRLGRQVTQRLCSTASAHVHGTTRARRCAKGRPPLPASFPPLTLTLALTLTLSAPEA